MTAKPDNPILLRRAGPQDAAAYAQIMGEEQVLANLMQLPYPSEESWRKRLAEPSSNPAELALVAERADDAGRLQVVGSAGLHPVGPSVRRRHAMVLGISVAIEAQGQGVGSALMQGLCDYADNWAQVLRIELTVFVDNQRADRKSVV